MHFLLRYPRATLKACFEPAKAVKAHMSLFLLLIRRDFKTRTSGTVLGAGWMLIQPALQVVAFWFLLDFVLKVRFPGHNTFLDYFLIGMLPWLMMAEVMVRTTGVLREFAPLYQRAIFPVELLPLLPVAVSGIVYGGIYFIVVLALEGLVPALLALALFLSLLIWLLPVSYLLAIIGLFVKDVAQVFPFVVTMLLYLTPILYMPAMLPSSMQDLLVINPIADLLAQLHALLQQMPLTPGNLLRPWLLWLLLLAPAWGLFHRSIPHMREAL